MAYLTLFNYDDNYAEVDIAYAQMQFYNWVNGQNLIDFQGNRWTASVTDVDDVKIVNLGTVEDVKYNEFSVELQQSLEIWGLMGVGASDIRALNYTGDKFGKSTHSEAPWMQLISQDLQGTHIIYRNPPDSASYDPIIGFFGDGLPMYASPLCVKFPLSEDVWYGHIAFGYGGAGNSYTHVQIVMCRFLTQDSWGELSVVPGAQGFIPTHTKPSRDKKGIGGEGSGALDHGKRPGYDSDQLGNPDAPDETKASAIGSGLICAYDITKGNLETLAHALYGSTLSGFLTNLAINPLDFIVSLNVFPVTPSIGASTYVRLGRWVCRPDELTPEATSGFPLTAQFKKISFGSVTIGENWGSFLDYSHTQIELYLPFIGCVDIDTSEVMNGSIDLDYTIDFLTGMCVANVNCNRIAETPDGYSYNQYAQHSYQGNCAISIPLSQIQYGNMIGSLIEAGTTGLRTGNPAVGVAQLAGDAVSGGMRLTATTKGTLSANAGFCSTLIPYVRITRPISIEPDSFQEVVGYTSYIDSYLGECNDLCVCESIDLHSIVGATDSEIERIRQMCLEGVHV